MNQSPMAGITAQGPLPAGMLRIRLGNQERYVWPVHLSGWLTLGWQVAGAEITARATAEAPSVGGTPAEPPAPSAAAAGEPPEQDDPKPASTRSRRGRRRKEEPEQQERPTTAIEATPEPTGTTAEADAADSEPMAAPEAAEEAATTPGDDTTSDGDHTLSALPDDLFDDPLI